MATPLRNTTPSPLTYDFTCSHECSYYYALYKPCQCYFGCHHYNDCCPDFMDHCDGMAAIEEQEKEALAQVAAFSVFYSIVMFVLLLVMLLWASYTLYTHCKKSGGRSYGSGVILKDNKLMIILSYIGMSLYVLSLFCYLISNGSLGVQYNSHNDVYGNSQITAIIFWFLGHTLFYILFMLKLYYFIKDTTYNLNKILQVTAFSALATLWLASFIVMVVWIDEFHRNYHYGSINNSKILACMVIAFAAHIWFCLSLVLFFSMVLYRVIQNRATTLLHPSAATDRLSSSELKEKVSEYMTRITVLCLSGLFVTVLCMLCWIILIALQDVSAGYLRFCWWLFPVNVLFSYLSMFLALNFHPNMNDVYKKVCICPHAFCKFYCVRATMPSARQQSKRGTKVRDYDDEDEEEEEEDDDAHGQLTTMNVGNNQNDNDKDDEEDDEDEESDDSEDHNLRGNERHQFNTVYQTALNSGE